MAIDRASLAIVEKMWRREVEAATTYRHLAERERDTRRRDILNRLADQEDNHAERWADRIEATTGRRPDRKPIERGLTWFQRISDPNVVLHRLEQEENRAEAEYDGLMARLTDPTTSGLQKRPSSRKPTMRSSCGGSQAARCRRRDPPSTRSCGASAGTCAEPAGLVMRFMA